VGIPVLVVDDEDTIRATLRWLLTDAGYTVYEAANGEQAVQFLHQQRNGVVVLLDYSMPRMDGLQVLQTIEAESPRAGKHAFILMSARYGLVPPELARELQQLGVPTIDKPFDVDMLLARVAIAAQPFVQRSALTRRLSGPPTGRAGRSPGAP
jgi:two-component system response regulator (stage 0 sporulation protein F)